MINPPITGIPDLDAFLYELHLNGTGNDTAVANTASETPDFSAGAAPAFKYRYIQIKYADDATGTGLSDTPTNKSYWGIFNSDLTTESTNPAYYTWFKTTGFGTTYKLYYSVIGGRKIKFITATTVPGNAWTIDPGTAIDLDSVSSLSPEAITYINSQESVGALLTKLTGAITSAQLYSSLGNRIDLIDASESVTGSVAYRVAQEATARGAAITAEANERIAAINVLQTQVSDLQNTPTYSASVTYHTDDIVQYNGGLYRALGTTHGNLPTNTTYWVKIGDYTSLGGAVSAMAVELADHETRITQNATDITAEATARTTLAATVASNTAAITTEATTRATNDTAIAATVSLLNTRVGNSEASILTEATTRATNDTALSDTITALASSVTDRFTTTNASITTESTTRATQDTALATSITNLASSVAGEFATTNAAITTEATTRADANTATATRIDNLTTTVTDNFTTLSSSITTEATTRTTNEAAIASRIDTVIASVGTNSTAIQTEATSRATETGNLFSKYTVKIDTNGYVSGFGLASEANNSTPYSDFIIRADKFSIASPSGPGISPIVPFVVTTTPTIVNGVTIPAGVYMDSAYIKYLTATEIAVGSLPAISGSSMTGSGARIQADGKFALGTAQTNITYDGNAIVINGNIVSTSVAADVSVSGRGYEIGTAPISDFYIGRPIALTSFGGWIRYTISGYISAAWSLRSYPYTAEFLTVVMNLYPRGAQFSGSVNGGVLTVSSVDYGTIGVGDYVNSYFNGHILPKTTRITSFGTGTGGVGTYNINTTTVNFADTPFMSTYNAQGEISNSITPYRVKLKIDPNSVVNTATVPFSWTFLWKPPSGVVNAVPVAEMYFSSWNGTQTSGLISSTGYFYQHSLQELKA